MAITIRGYEVEVNVARELDKYSWNRVRWVGEKFLACSPFRFERRPSFAVRLDNGVWIDSGTDDESWKRGNFVKLLAWLRNETYEEAEEYLLQEYYSVYLTSVDGIVLDINLNLNLKAEALKPLDTSILKPYLFRHPYLENVRGIDERTQRSFQVGYDRERKAISLPWFDRSGSLINIKFRSVKDKRFWYYEGGRMIKNHLFGFHLAKGERKIYVVESEIDAMTLWQAGYASVALGGAILTAKQRELLLQANIDELVIATDNDKAGRLIAKSISDELSGYMDIYNLIIPDHAKDINDLSREELLSVVENKTTYAFVV